MLNAKVIELKAKDLYYRECMLIITAIKHCNSFNYQHIPIYIAKHFFKYT